jgi:signal transduction histidine kinase
LAGVIVILLALAIGMAFSIRTFEQAATAQITHVRAKEYEITAVERLRWSAEAIVSAGRAFLLTGDDDALGSVRVAEATFDRVIVEVAGQGVSAVEKGMIADVERAAHEFRDAQERLFAAREGATHEAIAEQFTLDLLPRRDVLRTSVTRLVGYKEAALADVYRLANGQRRYVALRLYGLLAILSSAGLAGLLIISRRLTRAFRKERDAVREARRAVAARDEMMGIVAHDLRNPLGAISLQASLIRRMGPGEKTREQAGSIENVALRMEHLIRTMLDAATMEAGRFSIAPAGCDVERLLRECVAMFAATAGGKQIHLGYAPVEEGLEIWADRERLLQVLSNLVGNALKFTPRGGEVVLAATRQGAAIRFSVSDTGPGIPSENRGHVFERFWKSETGGTRGTGLGLYIAREIVEAHGGQIGVESRPGGGSTFHFTVPGESSSPNS